MTASVDATPSKISIDDCPSGYRYFFKQPTLQRIRERLSPENISWEDTIAFHYDHVSVRLRERFMIWIPHKVIEQISFSIFKEWSHHTEYRQHSVYFKFCQSPTTSIYEVDYEPPQGGKMKKLYFLFDEQLLCVTTAWPPTDPRLHKHKRVDYISDTMRARYNESWLLYRKNDPSTPRSNFGQAELLQSGVSPTVLKTKIMAPASAAPTVRHFITESRTSIVEQLPPVTAPQPPVVVKPPVAVEPPVVVKPPPLPAPIIQPEPVIELPVTPKPVRRKKASTAGRMPVYVLFNKTEPLAVMTSKEAAEDFRLDLGQPDLKIKLLSMKIA